MGADWVRFRIREGVDLDELREVTRFINENDPHGGWVVRRPEPPHDPVMVERLAAASQRLQELIVRLDTPLRDGGPEFEPTVDDLGLIRVVVVSSHIVFPIEWRDAASRTILPEELPGAVRQWREYLSEIRSGFWRAYLYDLHLFELTADDYNDQEIGLLVENARESLTLTNAWCRKETLPPIRDAILEFDAISRWRTLRAENPLPRFDEAVKETAITDGQREREQRLVDFSLAVRPQIREWNRLVPGKWKVRYPQSRTFEEFLAQAGNEDFEDFLNWCDILIERGEGLYHWH